MNDDTTPRLRPRSRLPRRVIAVAAAFLLGGACFSAPAVADPRHDPRAPHTVNRSHPGSHHPPVHRHADRHVHHHHAPAPVGFAPRWIGPEFGVSYRPHYRGSVYFAPHRHFHAVYEFPVPTRYGPVVVKSHVYCNGHLWEAPLPEPRIELRLRF